MAELLIETSFDSVDCVVSAIGTTGVGMGTEVTVDSTTVLEGVEGDGRGSESVVLTGRAVGISTGKGSGVEAAGAEDRMGVTVEAASDAVGVTEGRERTVSEIVD